MLNKVFKTNFVEFFIALSAFCFSIFFFSLVADDYGGFTYYSLPAGQFSDYPYLDWYYLAGIGIKYIYMAFYALFPAYNWTGISFIGFTFLALVLMLKTIKDIIFKNSQNIFLIRAFQILFSLFYLENFASISHTRFSLPLCGIGLFNLAFISDIKPKGVILHTAIFVLGMLIRPESSIGILLLVSGGYLIWNFDLKHWAKRFYLPVLFTALLFTAFYIDWKHTDVYVKQVEPEIEYKMMARRVVDISTMKTAEDSIKYQAARMGMWFDYKILTPDYLRSLQLPTFDLNPNLVTDQKLARSHSWHPGIDLGMQHVVDVLLHVFTFYRDYAFSPAVIFTFIWLSFLKRGNRKSALNIFLFSLYTFLLVYMIDYNAFMVGERHFIGFQIISLIIIVFYFFHTHDLMSYNKWVIGLSLLSLLTGSFLTLKYYKRSNNDSAIELKDHQEEMERIEATYQNRLIVLTNDKFNLFDRRFSILNNNYINNRYIIFDVFTYSLTPNYLNYLGSQCNCDPGNPVAFFQWLSDKHALYIAGQFRFDLTEKYMELVHHQKIKFLPAENFKEISAENHATLVYELRRVVVEN